LAYHGAVLLPVQTSNCRAVAAYLLCTLTLFACQDDPLPDWADINLPPVVDAASPDAPGRDASGSDASSADASGLDAAGACPGRALFAGSYEDWDSTSANFDGIESADVIQADDAANTAMTGADGSMVMCLPAARTAVDFTQPEYLDLRYTASPGGIQLPFVARGLRPIRADDLFTLELGMSRDVQASIVTISVRSYPAGDSVVGATVILGNAHAGAFTADATGVLGPDDTVIDSPFILFANVDVAGGTSTVQVVAPVGVDCQGPSSIDLVSGAVAAADFVCSGSADPP
jgi:hypothetical protein